jgi:hypothetical protein
MSDNQADWSRDLPPLSKVPPQMPDAQPPDVALLIDIRGELRSIRKACVFFVWVFVIGAMVSTLVAVLSHLK